MNELQALVTGMLMGALMAMQSHIALEVEALVDDEGNYLPEFNVVGKNTGTRLKVRVEVEE